MRDSAVFDQLVRAARALGDLVDDLVFVGGATTGLFLTDPGASEVRPTDDVDAIVEVSGKAAYYALAQRMRKQGFSEDSGDEAVVCRWLHRDGIILDVMPTDARILGFTNIWYAGAIAASVRQKLTADLSIRLVTPPYFCATKLEAFRQRGGGDHLASHDLEDVIAVIDGREELIEEIRAAERSVRRYLGETVSGLLDTPEFLEALPGLLMPDPGSQARRPLLTRRLETIARLIDS